MPCGCNSDPCGCDQDASDDEVLIVDGKACPPNPCGDPEYKQLTPGQARRTVAQTQARTIDRARQTLTRLGFRPYNVDLVFTKWSGATRGDGIEQVFKRIAITPSPKLIDLSSISMSPVATGVMPMGSIRLDKISVCYTSDVLMGRLAGDKTEEPYGFHYEVYEDGRTGTSERMKFRPSAQPTRRPFGWTVTLERISEDPKRDGTPAGAEP